MQFQKDEWAETIPPPPPPPQISLATLAGQIVDPVIAMKFEMRDILEVHDTQT